MPSTMRDVAKRANVSIKTVSRVVNNQGETSAATRQRVMAVIKELGYRPSRVARALVTQQTHTLGLVVSDITNPFFPEIARGVQDAAREAGYNVFLCNTDGDSEQELSTLESLADHGVDGIIIYPSYDSQDILKTFVAYYRPLVVINIPFDHPAVSQVVVDNIRGTKLVVDYLISQGHTAIAMLTGVKNASFEKARRVQGFRDALAAHNIPVVEEWLIPCDEPTFACGEAVVHQFLKKPAQITAIFAYNDLLALGAIWACNRLGRRVPDECAVIGFDDIQWAATATPTLTTVSFDKYELGRQAMKRVLEMLKQPGGIFPPINLDMELVIRESA